MIKAVVVKPVVIKAVVIKAVVIEAVLMMRTIQRVSLFSALHVFATSGSTIRQS